ncbi:MAG TPA: adenylate/guanylate cyclase domain-containing protein [Candidatus Angelobacter sp.]|nr:adenylate/guanylate cyclase domain-containing protein [Candidatus Angelobacter sp.]
MHCSACGTENRPNSRFCDHCGSPLEAACPSCGTSNRADARFCSGCGTTLAATPSAARPAAPAPTTARGAGAEADADQPSAAQAHETAERRLVSVLFTDLVGFTTLAEDRDPEAVRELLSRYFDLASDIVQMHGGTVEKFIGDAVMAVWGTPVAHEDDAERAVRAALELVSRVPQLNPGLQARAGVLSGDAAVTIGATNQGMVAGDLVNTAARLQGVAEAGTVLVGEATVRAAENAIVFEPIGDHSLKGKTAPVPAFRAVRVVAARGGQQRGDALEPPFVGREEELRQLKDVLHAVGRERRPRLVSITGPGGIGKSRLVWELEKYVDGVTEIIWWHRGRSPSYGEGVTFWALGEMVRRRAGLTEEADEVTTRARIAAILEEFVADPGERQRIGPALLTLLGLEGAPAGGRDALFPAWRLFFERIAEQGTTVLVFEDLQWADAGLLDFIDHLLDWTRGLPIMVVTLARPELFDRRPDWGAGSRQLTALALEPLADEDMRQLLEGLVPGLPADALAAILGRAEGVPLYAVEMVRGLLADQRIERRGEAYVPCGDLAELRVPDSLRALIASRLDTLDPADRNLLQDASVLGQVFRAEALAAVLEVPAAELEPRLRDLARRELLDVERDPMSPELGQYKFVQSLIREVAYGTLSRRDRRARHLAVARHYEAIGDDELAGALASHYLSAHEASEPGPEADAVAGQARIAAAAAAERAQALGSPEQAMRHLEQAIRLATDPVERAGLQARAATAAAAAAIDAVPLATAVIETYEELGDAEAATGARIQLGRIHLDASRLTAATEVLRPALADATAAGNRSQIAAASASLARGLMRLGEPEAAIAAADEALLIAERDDLEADLAEALGNKGAAMHMVGRRREAAALLRASLEVAQRVGLSSMEVRVRNNLATALDDDDPAGANKIILEAIEIARRIGDRSMLNWLIGNSAEEVVARGSGWDEQYALLVEGLEHAPLSEDRLRMIASMALFESMWGMDASERRDELLALAPDSADDESIFVRNVGLADIAFGIEDFDDVHRCTEALRPMQVQALDVPARRQLLAAVWGGREHRIREAAAWIDNLPGWGARRQALRTHAAAAIAALDGRRADALNGFRDAQRRMLALEERFTAALAAIEALHLAPHDAEVRSWVSDARPLLAELRATPVLQRADALLAASPSAGHAPVPATADERVPG